MNKVIYLCGPIHDCTEDEIVEWRQYVRTQVSYLHTVSVLDPTDRDFRTYDVLTDKEYKEIVELDKIDVALCDILFVNFNKAMARRASVGSSMEMLYAWEKGKHIIVANTAVVELSPWVHYHSHSLVDTLDAAIEEVFRLVKD